MSGRNIFIDALRGICILGMILVHFSQFLPFPLRAIFSVGIDAVAEGFIFLAGTMISYHYLPKFIQTSKKVTIKLLQRAIEILIKNYLMILTIWIPIGLFIKPKIFHNLIDILIYIKDVFLLQIQPFALDILPLFSILIGISPLILFLLKKRMDYILILISIILFIYSLKYPFALSIKQDDTFPPIQWQIYFILGVFWGKLLRKKKIQYGKKNFWLLISGLFFIINIYIRHLSSILNWIIPENIFTNIQFQKFPLNIYGFIYGVATIFFVYQFFRAFWHRFSKIGFFNSFLPVFGQNSLRAFILHVYFDYLIKYINLLYQPNKFVVYILIILDIVVLYFILKHWDKIINSIKNVFIKGMKDENIDSSTFIQ